MYYFVSILGANECELAAIKFWRKTAERLLLLGALVLRGQIDEKLNLHGGIYTPREYSLSIMRKNDNENIVLFSIDMIYFENLKT